MTIQSAVKFNFANGLALDPRWNYSRGSTGYVRDRLGVIRNTLANHPRFEHDLNGLCLGLLLENAATNKILWSRVLSNAAWTKTNLNVLDDQAVSFDGTTVLDQITASGADGSLTQGFTITAGRAIIISAFARPSATNWIKAWITDGTNTVNCWYNVSTGATGTNTAGAGTCVYLDKNIENWGGGLYRFSLTVTTSISTSFTCGFSPCAADNTNAVNTDSVFLGDIQVEDGLRCMTSPVISTGSQGTRAVDVMNITLANAPWWNSTEGTIGVDYVVVGKRTASGANVIFGYSDNAGFDNTVYVTYDEITQGSVFATVISGGVGQGSLSGTASTLWAPGSRNRMMLAWKANDVGFCVNGGTVAVDTVVTLPVLDSGARLTLGGAPWQSNSGTGFNSALAAFEYWPRRMSDTFMRAWSRV